MKRITLPSLFIVLALLLSSCSLHLGLSSLLGGNKGTSSSSSTVKATHTPPAGNATSVAINNGKFRPKNITVKVGTTVTWTNNDSTKQSVTSDTPGLFDSGLLAPGATFKYTFDKTGVFPYHSIGASGTFGSVTVTQ